MLGATAPRRVRELLARAATGQLRPSIGARYPLAAARAHADLEGRRSTGKIVLIP